MPPCATTNSFIGRALQLEGVALGDSHGPVVWGHECQKEAVVVVSSCDTVSFRGSSQNTDEKPKLRHRHWQRCRQKVLGPRFSFHLVHSHTHTVRRLEKIRLYSRVQHDAIITAPDLNHYTLHCASLLSTSFHLLEIAIQGDVANLVSPVTCLMQHGFQQSLFFQYLQTLRLFVVLVVIYGQENAGTHTMSHAA